MTSFSSADQRERLQHALRQALQGLHVITDPEVTRTYECDALCVFRHVPLAVILPRDEHELHAALTLCFRLNLPVVPRGAGTGVSGGATPHAEGVVISTARFNRILHLCPETATARVQPGVRNAAVSEAAAPFGYYYAPDPSSQIACTLGGNVAENAGGVHCLKYGLTVHNVMQVRGYVMGMNGPEAVTFGGEAPDAPGLDLMALAHGSEGMLFVATEITVRLIRKPPAARLILASFATVKEAAEATAAVIGAGIIPAGLEMMDKRTIAAVEAYVHAGYDLDAAAMLLCESDGEPAAVDDEIERMTEVLRKAGATRLCVSQNEAERLNYWSGRKAAFPALGRISPDYLCMDGVIPRKRLADMLAAIAKMEDRYGLRCANVFHAGDGNLHPLILYDANLEGETERALAFGGEILETCVRMGGSITGEHGVGLEKLKQMPAQFTPQELARFHEIKHAFDPSGHLNPGKAIPAPAHCREYRALSPRRSGDAA